MLTKEKTRQLSKSFEDSFGSPSELARILDLGIEMLFYLEEDTFERRDIQSVVSAIRGIIEVLRLED